MSDTIRYAHKGDLFSLIETALGANGYTIEIPLQSSANGTIAMIMTCGRASVLIGQRADRDGIELEVWGLRADAAMDILESLQTPFSRLSLSFVVETPDMLQLASMQSSGLAFLGESHTSFAEN
jgi:hypothetical protein